MKNKKVLIFLLVGLAIMAVMLYFIGIGEVIEALKSKRIQFMACFISYCYTDLYLFFIHMEMEHHQQDR